MQIIKTSVKTSVRASVKTSVNPFELFKKIQQVYTKAFFFQTREDLTVIGLEAEEILRFNSKSDVATLKYLENRLAKYQTPSSSRPYENGGAFGILGYDLVRHMEPCLKSKLPSGSKNNDLENYLEGEIHFVKKLIVFDHKTKKISLYLNSKTRRHPKHKAKHKQPNEISKKIGETSEIGEKEFLTSLIESNIRLSSSPSTPISATEKKAPLFKPAMGEKKYLQSVARIKKHIIDGDIFQAVLAEKLSCKTKTPPLQIFERLRSQHQSPYSFYFGLTDRVFFGASPETLVKVKIEGKNRKVETHPIAGTMPRGKTSPPTKQSVKPLDHRIAQRIDKRLDKIQQKKLLTSAKESAEHLMLVDLARNDLGRVSKPGSVQVTAFRQVMKLTNVMHIISKVQGDLLPNMTPLAALIAGFPAGTLSGAPKIRAMEILADLETCPRGLYGGAVVAFDFGGNLDSCIAIRSMEISDSPDRLGNYNAVLKAGAGIVADSDPKSEYQEVHHKLKPLKEALQ